MIIWTDIYRQGHKEDVPLQKIVGMNAEQIWMREPRLQCGEEFNIYREIFEFVAADLKEIDWKGDVITEGAAYLPKLMKQFGIGRVQQ